MKSNVFLFRHLKEIFNNTYEVNNRKRKDFFSLFNHDKHRMNELSETMDDTEVKSLRYFILYF